MLNESLQQIKKAILLDKVGSVLAIFLLLGFFPPLLMLGILGLILKCFARIIAPKKEYILNDKEQELYNNICEIIQLLKTSNKIWQVISQDYYNSKNGLGVKKIPIKIVDKIPFFLGTNIKVYGLLFDNYKMYFLPEGILLLFGNEIKLIDYSNVTASCKTCMLVERNTISKDATVIGMAWEKSNRDGSPDLRFKTNRKVPMCEYLEIDLTVKPHNGKFKFNIIVSNLSLLARITDALEIVSSMLLTDFNLKKIIIELDDVDPLFEDVSRFIIKNQSVSTVLLQHNYGFNYNRAIKLIEEMQEKGIISPYQENEGRKVLVPSDIAVEFKRLEKNE